MHNDKSTVDWSVVYVICLSPSLSLSIIPLIPIVSHPFSSYIYGLVSTPTEAGLSLLPLWRTLGLGRTGKGLWLPTHLKEQIKMPPRAHRCS